MVLESVLPANPNNGCAGKLRTKDAHCIKDALAVETNAQDHVPG